MIKLALKVLLLLLPLYSFAQDKPDIVVILADDIGLGDISFHNRQVIRKTPVVETANIDSLAERGVWLTDAHSATALCAPTRFAVMTGKNNYRSYAPWGVWGSFQKNAISKTDLTLGSVARKSGYRTGFVGKWHLGGDFERHDGKGIFRGRDEGNLPDVELSRMVGGGPNDLGFDYSYMLPDGIQGPLYLAYENQIWSPLADDSSITYLNENSVNDIRTISDKGDGMGDSGWDTTKMGDKLSAKAVEFIKAQPENRPLFLYYASPMAHLPHMPPATFDNIKVSGSTPSAHLDMVYELDLQVGRIIEALKSQGRFDNTLIIFTSDNGGLTYRVPGTLESGHQPSGGFRGSKNAAHEGGHRVPFIISWPAKFKVAKQYHGVAMVQDILATIAEAAGAPLTIQQAPDSTSLLSAVEARTPLLNRQHLMLQGGSRNEVIYRKGKWKLILQSDHQLTKYEPIALFDLSDNVYEKESGNLIHSAQHQTLIRTLRAEYIEVRQTKIPTVAGL